jgi:hypothetical protein
MPVHLTNTMQKPNSIYCFFALIALLSFASCQTGYVAQGIKANQIKDIACLPPIISIQVIEQGNQGLYDPFLSQKAAAEYKSLIEIPHNQKFLHLSNDTLPTMPIHLQRRIMNEGHYLVAQAVGQRSVQNLPISPTIDSVLEANNKRYGMICVENGFTRTKQNQRDKAAETVGIGLLTLGMYIPISYSAGATMYCVLVDAQTNQAIYCHSAQMTDNEPDNPETISKLLSAVFRDFFD